MGTSLAGDIWVAPGMVALWEHLGDKVALTGNGDMGVGSTLGTWGHKNDVQG